LAFPFASAAFFTRSPQHKHKKTLSWGEEQGFSRKVYQHVYLSASIVPIKMGFDIRKNTSFSILILP
jgi:hypothetical protein